MAAFRYTAYDAAGKEQNGLLEADSARAARAQLRERGLLPVAVDSVNAKTGNSGSNVLRRGLPRAELVMLTEQLSTLLNAGLTLEKALTAVTEQAESPRARTVLAALRSDILEGKSFAQALSAAPGVFSPLYRSLVQAGEQSGHLDMVMARLAEYLDKRQNTQQKVTLALAYPAVVTFVAILVVSGLMTYVVPQVVSVFAQTKQSLPFLTRALVACSDFLRQWGLLLLASIVAAVALTVRALRAPLLKRRFHAWVLRLPVFGRLFRALNTARMASTMSILVGSGVPLLTALETARGLMTMLPMQDAVADAMAKVREGVSLSRALNASKQFPPVLIHLISSGEASGTLSQMLDRAAQQQEQEVERKLATFTTLMEPLLILVMGGMVLLIVLAIMMPIIDMNQMVH
ncbi:type II secretion system inner membrane protein GspF [Chromobacterium subtsugae]|uniref:General secretion pathway protein F n=1 Tax=Chromobacterium subtsugae TaxID=251747 RepID=A0ABS7FGG8_9NEIS|nr:MULTISPECIES: type II secretion system inner membrane protein GspF [Chromobacterium]KUM00007.1 type II secretion system protein GspF [Chromobacterium subtsugae]KZE86321.1 type II secretion system protein GspF [Chromobacterium sp. F49]MBW7567943.1 type II secretion system inner membrane protein GspF [Chromobacterium subtsugae]MBW8289170.1 type II secretion system inner membrane protein GspF [Chromobacterium subtsugae]OBU86428.1 general secretion pathway protein GspF [Chromobacterium subtsuga